MPWEQDGRTQWFEASGVGKQSGMLQRPVPGKVLSSFGMRFHPLLNERRMHTDRRMQARWRLPGAIAYAGNELKGYGNLVLLRHDNGWVTAYAHNDELLVKRGQKVKRGQVIAKAGKTGSVDQPQVHFELRQGSKPVDPLPYLEKL